MNNRGQIPDLLLGLILVFVIAVVLLVVTFVVGAWNAKLETIASVNETGMLNATETFMGETVPVLDSLIPFLFIGLNIAIMILCYLSRGQPLFFIFIILLMPVLILTAAVLQDAYNALAASPALAATASTLVYTYTIINNWVLLEIIFGFLDSVILLSGFTVNRQSAIMGG